MSFAHLHVHTDASPDGLGTVENLVKLAAEQGQKILAMTDHGTLANTVRFYKACKANDITPIIGVEGYIVNDGKRGHITVLADGERGYNNLIKLQNEAHKRHQEGNRFASFGIDDLIKYNEDLIVLTGCVASPMHQMSLKEAIDFGRRLKNVYEDRLYAEIMHVGDHRDIWERSIHLSEALNLPLIATNDVHFQRKQDAPLHPILTQMKMSYDYNSEQLWLKTEQEMISRGNALGIPNFEVAVTNAGILAAKLRSPNVNRKQFLPKIQGSEKFIVDNCWKNLNALGLDTDSRYVERLQYEISVMQKIGFEDYFYILKDIVDYARNSGIKIGPGRGSGAGSLMLFLMNITEVDPIIYDLQFERFLNPERKGLPDVDTDYDPNNRQYVMKYSQDRWNGVPVAAYSHLTDKVLVHRLAKAFGYSREDEREAADGGETSEAFKRLEDDYPLFSRCFDVMEGQIFGPSQHAAGIMMYDDSFDLPLERLKSGDLGVAFSESSNGGEDLKYAGGVKFDMLGVSALTGIDALEKAFNIFPPKPHETPYEKRKEMLDALLSGKVRGLFQFTTPFAYKVLMNIVSDATPDNLFERLVIATTITRPAVPNDLKEKFHEFMQNPRKVHPIIDAILEPTGGISIYQEQMMKLFATIAGGGFAAADLARRAITKIKVKDKKDIRIVRADAEVHTCEKKFFDGGIAQGIDEEILEQVWTEILASAGYGFNRSHGVAYMFVAWEQLYFYTLSPSAYYCSLMNVDANEREKVFEHLFHAAETGVNIVAPHINHSSDKYEYDEENIYVPLTAVKGLSSGAEVIVNERNTNGLFKSIEDFRNRVPKRSCNAGVAKSLYELKAFDGIEGNWSDFKIKDREPDKMLDVKLQYRNLGYVLPTPEIFGIIKKNMMGWQGGLIVSKTVKDKNNGKGPYAIIRYWPDSQCVARPVPSYEEGDIVFFKHIRGLDYEFRSVRLK